MDFYCSEIINKNNGRVEVVPTTAGTFWENIEEPDGLKSQYNSKVSNGIETRSNRMSINSKFSSKAINKKRQDFKLLIPLDKKYFPIIGWDGPCTVLVNLGTHTFHAPHSEFRKGLNT